jgi:NAD(P)-dependent dehydrogenase (short-subunit alcohol dehydrogenase family)
LIVGWTSWLWLSLAEKYSKLGHKVHVTGRHNPNITDLEYHYLDITEEAQNNITNIDGLIAHINWVNTLIYSAGYFQEWHIDAIHDNEIRKMLEIWLHIPILLVKRLKFNPLNPLKVILITSSSQYTARELEPVYTTVKAWLGMFWKSLSLDAGIGKVCVFAPSGMQTPFWSNEKDRNGYLDSDWVADKIIEYSWWDFKYRYTQILRNPNSVNIIEELPFKN